MELLKDVTKFVRKKTSAMFNQAIFNQQFWAKITKTVNYCKNRSSTVVANKRNSI